MEQKDKKVIAVVGMSGSGKTEVVEYLMKKYRWPKVYFGQVTFDKLKEEGKEINWKNERYMREKIRQKHGMGAYAEFSVPRVEKELKRARVCLVESLYSWEEYKIMQRHFQNSFRVLAVYASPAVRFARLQNRQIRPIKTFKEFQERDWNEIEATDKGGPIAVADHTIINGGSLEELHRKVDKVIKQEMN